MNRCKSCRTRAEAVADICPVCGIDQDKDRKELTPREKQVRRAALNIHFAAMLHLIGAGIFTMALPDFEHRFALALIVIINFIIGIGLLRYDYRAYKIAVIFYFGIGMVNIIAVNLLALPLVLLLLYVVGNKTAKAIFERRFPDNE